MENFSIATTKEIKPQGWFKKQLEIQANGLSGNLDKIWPDIKDSAWIGGKKEGWERVPYWLDGFVPLAYLLDDEDMKQRAKKYIDAILLNQKEDGWICPCSEKERKKYDNWALQLISKVLVIYYDCTGDERIPPVLYKAMKNYLELLKVKKIKLFNWGKFRWFETFIALNFLYEKYKEPWIIELAELLEKQGFDYTEATKRWKKAKRKWRYDTHVVNLAMMLKEEAVTTNLLGDKKTGKAEKLFEILNEYNGTPVGTFTGDECLSGLSPIQGTELCSVAEIMYSYELLYAKTQNPKWAELLELAAFNALPATLSDDMWVHQYDQMSNQIACQKLGKKVIFRTNGAESHLFGLEPNFGCCTANFNQAFPKLALSAFMKNGNTILNAVPIPSEYSADGIKISLETDYPFKNKFRYKIETDKKFVFKIRIPSFAKNLTLGGENVENSKILSFEIEANEAKDIDLSFETEAKLIDRPHGLKSVKCGSLIFSVPIEIEKKMLEYEKDGVERKFPYCDFEYLPKSEWQYALCSQNFTAEEREIGEIPFSSANPPLVLKAKLKRIDWGFEKGYTNICAKVPRSTEAYGEVIDFELYPYGCSKLRITEMKAL